MDKKQLLSDFLNGRLSREQLSFELSKNEPLFFEVMVDGPHDKPGPDNMGFYEDKEGNKVYQPYSWFSKESKHRNIAICLHNHLDNEILARKKSLALHI